MEEERKRVKQNRWVIATMIFIFVIYNFTVYTQGTSNQTVTMTDKAIEGEILFQNNNCTACHQLYGLGGYLGPDLTNIISKENKGSEYVKAFLNSGVKTMPKFDFNEEEKEAIVQFLTEVNQTGYYPCFDVEKGASGWVELKYKNQ